MAQMQSKSLATAEKAELLHYTQAHQFAARDLALYLDTHPTDSEAHAAFKKHIAAYQEGAAVYQERFGALTMAQAVTGDGWAAWSNTPWPWDKEAN